MNTNAQVEIIDKLTRQLDSLYGLPGVALTFLVCIGIGYLFKLWEVFPNKWIPLPVVLCGIACNIGLRPPPAAGVPMWQHLFRLGIVGFIIGVTACIAYDRALKKLEQRFFGGAEDAAVAPPTPPK